jgi:hypothetical protein
VAPLRLGGLRGKQSTPSDWLGGTGEVSTVGKQERKERGTSIEARTTYEAGTRKQVRSFILLSIMH